MEIKWKSPLENLHQKTSVNFLIHLQADVQPSTWKNSSSPSYPTLLKVKQAAVELLQKDGHLKVAKRVFVGGYGNPSRSC